MMERAPVTNIINRKADIPCLKRAYRFLARRDHGVMELRAKLVSRGYPDDEIDTVVGKLLESGYLNDERVCRAFADGKVKKFRIGPRRLKNDLRKKGFDEELVANVVMEQFGCDEDVERVALESAGRKLRLIKQGLDDESARRKLYHHLLNKGFAVETARKIALDEYVTLKEEAGR